MTPKEKAKELVQRFIAHAYHNNNELQCKEHSKQCALIAVDEILDISYWAFMESGGKQEQEYWQEVKQEIINI